MTTYIDFRPSDQALFQFQLTLDGQVYAAICTWNLYGQRYYVNLYDAAGVRIFSLPQIGSPLDSDISLTAGYFDSTLVYRVQNQQFEVSP